MLTVTEMVTQTTNRSDLNCTLPHDEGRLPLVLLYSAVLLVGLPANLLTVLLTGLQVRRKNVLGVYLCSLSVCDLTYLGTLPLWAIYVNSGHRWPWSSAFCKLTGYIFFNNMYISIFLLCCVSFDRCVAVVYSLESRGLRRQRHAAFVVLAIILVVAIGHAPVFTMKEGATEGSHHCFEPSQSSAMVTGFYYARFVIGFLLPLLLLVVTNRGILANVQRSTGLQSAQKRRVRQLAVGVVVLFLVCFAPYHIILLVRGIIFHFPWLDNCSFQKAMYTPYTISLGLSTINSAVNPILYVLSSNNIRKDLRRGLAQVCGRVLVRTPSNTSQNKIQPINNSLELNTGSERLAAGKPPGT
ncbi:probable G-protein coupled receptor 132b [Haplochromis burtoni]|uniref:Probable G-protein coupled receptor 132 n=1 Tax=Haplochromis burtoni TaxID=8153 RepID=A0A3Q2W345_HAPBU|nr:probable G-protein coupled receptor 132b [Haplochromis burtoni]XP_005950228.1 probable G-protein coupled receptor 132b [Haplochromis burtoni]XP_042071495.1 probable G-protein coupled receptor 132b [Haplochromis burtoni]